ncbi:ribonuclease III [Taylorella equigenitalis]|nr:ribonuclease III [Taylorella equigenitalis]AFN35592.1 ribonuclease 3 [Taylorella equigenitalis ATCC 35865]
MKLDELQKKLNYSFKDIKLLNRALTHRSFSSTHNERLEFLGDSILNFSVASLLFKKLKDQAEGDLTRIRASYVNQDTLAKIANNLKLQDLIKLGEGELKSGGFKRPSILADAVEAIFGAIYIDSNIEQAQKVVESIYEPLMKNVDFSTVGRDSKTLLQEFVQAKRVPLPSYKVLNITGAAHDQEFEVECTVELFDVSAQAVGASRRSAEQAAATLVLEKLKK